PGRPRRDSGAPARPRRARGLRGPGARARPRPRCRSRGADRHLRNDRERAGRSVVAARLRGPPARRVAGLVRPSRPPWKAPGRRRRTGSCRPRRSIVESIRYSARRFAEVLGLTPQELTEAETRGVLSRLRAEAPQRTSYTVDDLARARGALGRQPARRPMRKQLFLNFKGGTGK